MMKERAASAGDAPGHEWAGTSRFAGRFENRSDPRLFVSPEDVERYVRVAGFTSVHAWLEPEPTPFASRADYRVFKEFP